MERNSIIDLFIIGGGINGVAIAADAAGRGLSVTLCEQNDLASATSSASSKLIHGGLRYLEQYEFKLVREALREREILLRNAPHLISPLEFILPHTPKLRPAWLLHLGLFLYDHLWSKHLPSSKGFKLKNSPQGYPLQEKFVYAFSYYDCYADDARLVIANALAAKNHGANILTQTKFITAIPENFLWKIIAKNSAGVEHVFYSKALINASGPYLPITHQNIINNTSVLKINLIKGSHIVIPKLYEGNFAYILQHLDGRIIFTIPFQNNFTLIGTTDIFIKDPQKETKITPDEVNYLCDTINHYFKKSISAKDVVWSYAGIRCLQTDDEDKPEKISRDYKFILQKDQLPLVSVISGKITTHRVLAEKVIDALQEFFPKMKPCSTTNNFLPGGNFPQHNFENFYQKFTQEFSWLDSLTTLRLAHNYGTLAYKILGECKNLIDLGIHFGYGLYEKEVDYLIQHEWAQTVEDILWRRTKLGLFLNDEQKKNLEGFIRIKKGDPQIAPTN